MSKLNPYQVCANAKNKKNQPDAASISNQLNLRHCAKSDFEIQRKYFLRTDRLFKQIAKGCECRRLNRRSNVG